MKRILRAINEGIKRDLLLFDNDQITFGKTNNLNNTVSKLIFDEIINDLLKNNTITINDYKILLSTPYLYHVKSEEELQNIIRDVIDNIGPECNLNWLDTSAITDMGYLFYSSPFNGDISKWDVSNVKNMCRMFFLNRCFNSDISKWDVSNVTDMSNMFKYSKFNGDISKWDVSNVSYMFGMFIDSEFNGDISKWDVSNVKDMRIMFGNSKFNQNISNWDVGNVENMSYMFDHSVFNGDISKWDVSNVRDMSSMFVYSKFNKDISKWHVNKDANTDRMFEDCLIKDEYKPKIRF